MSEKRPARSSASEQTSGRRKVSKTNAKPRTKSARQKSTVNTRRKLLELLQRGEGGHDCAKVKLRGANLSKLQLRDVNFTSADLALTDLRGSDLSGTNFKKANLAGAKMGGTNLTGSDFRGANLTGVTFTGALIRKANFTGAEMDGVDFSSADLTKSMFTKGKGFRFSFDDFTMWANGKNNSGGSDSFPLKWWAGEVQGYSLDEQEWFYNPLHDEPARGIAKVDAADLEFNGGRNLSYVASSTSGSGVEWFLAVVLFVFMMVAFALGGKLFGAW